MQHIVGIETVLPQFVHHDFVSREIGGVFREFLLQSVDGKQEGGFAELVAVCSVFPMADRTDGEEYLQLRILFPKR